MLSLEDAWIKAAVEHRTLEITYFSKTKDETTVREVEPDYYGQSTNGRNFGCFGFCRLRGGDIRCFLPQNIVAWHHMGDSFEPPSNGRWQELIAIYQEKNLANAMF